jgi:hypothetical protein
MFARFDKRCRRRRVQCRRCAHAVDHVRQLVVLFRTEQHGNDQTNNKDERSKHTHTHTHTHTTHLNRNAMRGIPTTIVIAQNSSTSFGDCARNTSVARGDTNDTIYAEQTDITTDNQCNDRRISQIKWKRNDTWRAAGCWQVCATSQFDCDICRSRHRQRKLVSLFDGQRRRVPNLSTSERRRMFGPDNTDTYASPPCADDVAAAAAAAAVDDDGCCGGSGVDVALALVGAVVSMSTRNSCIAVIRIAICAIMRNEIVKHELKKKKKKKKNMSKQHHYSTRTLSTELSLSLSCDDDGSAGG